MARTKIVLPKSIDSEEIRKLWYNIKNLAEIATDLEEAIQSKTENMDRSLPQPQQNILMFIKDFNKKMDQFYYNPQSEHIKAQQYWLPLLSHLIRNFKEKKLTEAEVKEIIKKECIYHFRTDEEDYKSIDDDLDNNLIDVLQYKQLLMERITENEFRKSGDDPKCPHLVHDNFKNRDIDTFINEAWAKRLKRNDTAQGPEEEAKFVLGQILKTSLSKKEFIPIYFHNKEHLDKYKILIRLMKEFSIPFMSKIHEEIDKIKLNENKKKYDGWD